MSEKFIKFCPVCNAYFTDADKYARHIARYNETSKHNVEPVAPVKAEEDSDGILDSDSVENGVVEPVEPVAEKKRLGRPPKNSAK